jgi:hypothetical protein
MKQMADLMWASDKNDRNLSGIFQGRRHNVTSIKQIHDQYLKLRFTTFKAFATGVILFPGKHLGKTRPGGHMRDIKEKNPERGAALVELAMVLPLLLLIFVGIIEFGLLFYNQQVLTNASREGSRAGISHLTADEIKTIVVDYSDDRLINFGAGPNVDPDNVDVDPPNPDTVGFAEELTVSIIYDYTFLVPELLGFGTSMQLKAETVMKME